MGDQFLSHIERCKVLLHIIDSSSDNLIENYKIIRGELEKFGNNLDKKKEIIGLSKFDLTSLDKDTLSKKIEKELGVKPYVFSSASNEGIQDLQNALLAEFYENNDS